MSYTALPTKNPGDLLTSALWNTYLQGNADSGFARMLADTTLGASAASIDFASIPATFAHLLLIWTARSDSAQATANNQLRLNNDSGANYDYQRVENTSASAVGGFEGLAATSGVCGLMTAATATANKPGSGALLIPHYAGATFEKDYIAIGFFRWSTVTAQSASFLHGGTWRSNAAVNRITLLPSAGNYIAGSRATLYGLPQ